MFSECLSISDICIGCGQCVKVCIRGHLAVNDSKKAMEVDSPYYCFKCGHCTSVCPVGAITLKGTEEGDIVQAGALAFGKDDLMAAVEMPSSMSNAVAFYIGSNSASITTGSANLDDNGVYIRS